MFFSNIATLLGFVASAVAAPQFGRPEPQPVTGGAGPYKPASYSTVSALPRHTIYRPDNTPAGAKFPVMVWGNGGCGANGLAFQAFLTHVASQGIFVIANGAPNGSGQTTSAMLKEALDWIEKQAGTGEYSHVDISRVAAAGQSCGGLEAYDLAQDARVDTIGIFNSGYLDVNAGASAVPKITKPIFYFIGGSSDIAYANAERDWDLLPASTPRWKGNLNVGHGGTYNEIDGGKFGVAGAAWLNWVLRGNATAAAFFTGNGAQADGWSVEKAALEYINVAPL